MSIVSKVIVEDKSVSVSTLGKRMVKTVTIVCNAERGAMFGLILARIKIRQIFCMAVIAHIVLSKERVVTTETRKRFFFRKFFH